MATGWRAIALLLVVLWGVGAPRASKAELVRAMVLSIGDGDTLRVRQDGRTLTVRLACIDAPETTQHPFGAQARRHLQQRLPLGAPVGLNVKTRDRYGRLVAEVITEININLALVDDGQAFAYRRYLKGCDASAYLEAEQRARLRHKGVWQGPEGITRPWDFRRGLRPSP